MRDLESPIAHCDETRVRVLKELSPDRLSILDAGTSQSPTGSTNPSFLTIPPAERRSPVAATWLSIVAIK
jgi:hypothetical protein